MMKLSGKYSNCTHLVEWSYIDKFSCYRWFECTIGGRSGNSKYVTCHDGDSAWKSVVIEKNSEACRNGDRVVAYCHAAK